MAKYSLLAPVLVSALLSACSSSVPSTTDEPVARLSQATSVGGCTCPTSGGCSTLSYSDIPSDGNYYVTTFGGGDDTQGMSCGGTADGTWAYIADVARFGCGAKVLLEANGKSCVAQVADCGPNRCVEQAASYSGCSDHHPIIDASPYITRYLFDEGGLGYSDQVTVHATEVDSSTEIGCPGGCVASTEVCNGKDDDCDGQADEDGVCNQPPHGNLDGVSCDSISGWAQDPDQADQSIDVHLYFDGPAGSSSGKGFPMHANQSRDDLCSALGSCAHAFSVLSPLSLFDGAAHEVHAYGIDTAGGSNPELASSPKSLQCAASLPSGVRRAVSDAAASAWHFDPFWQKLPAAASEVDALASWTALPAAPQLIQVQGAPEVWLVDGSYRRHVPSPAVASAWNLDLGTVQAVSADALAGYAQGSDLRARPVLATASDGITYLIDDKQDDGLGDGGADATSPEASTSDAGVEDGGSDGGKKDAGRPVTPFVAQDPDGCACSLGAKPSGVRPALVLLAMLGLMLGRSRGKRR